jgi:hypothetical protein
LGEATVDQALRLVEQVTSDVCLPINMAGRDLDISASVGIASSELRRTERRYSCRPRHGSAGTVSHGHG